MRFAISAPNIGDAAALVEMGVAAERGGWDGFFLWDHLQLRPDEQFAVHDPWVLMGAIATRTERIQLGAMVTPLSRRRPQKLAKEIVTLDHLSGGRVIVGVGLGEPPQGDFADFGDASDPRIRGAMLDEHLAVLDPLLRGERVDHDGEHYTVHAQLRPRPVQSPRPPIWVAGRLGNRRPLARAQRFEGYAPIMPNSHPPGPEDIRRGLAGAELAEGFTVASSLIHGYPPADYADAGATWLIDSRRPVGEWLQDLTEAAHGGPPG